MVEEDRGILRWCDQGSESIEGFCSDVVARFTAKRRSEPKMVNSECQRWCRLEPVRHIFHQWLLSFLGPLGEQPQPSFRFHHCRVVDIVHLVLEMA